MTNLVNCGKLSLPKKFNEAVASIVCENNEYIVTLNDGFKFEWDSMQAIEHSQKAVLTVLKSIVFPTVETVETTENVVETVETVENKIEEKSEIISDKSNVVELNTHPIKNKKIENEIAKQFDDRIRAKIVFEYLVLGNKISVIEKKFPNASKVLQSLYLTEVNRGNFSGGLRNGAIIGTLKRHARFDLVRLFEIHFYGLNNNIQRFKNVEGIPM